MALERDGRRCRLCNSKERLEVHHRTYKRRGNEKLDDLTTLCHRCHATYHNKETEPPKPTRRRPKSSGGFDWDEAVEWITANHDDVFYP